MKHYKPRDTDELDRLGNYHFNHVLAMTGEKLSSKSAIAAELGYRDMLILDLEKKLARCGYKCRQLEEANKKELLCICGGANHDSI